MASGLTRNQVEPLLNAEENGTSHASAARGAAVGAENGPHSSDASDGRIGQGTASPTGVVAELAEVVDNWPVLTEPVRLAILALIRSSRSVGVRSPSRASERF